MKKIIKFSCAFLIAIVMMILLSGCGTQIDNAGFEKGGDNGSITGWKRFDYGGKVQEDNPFTQFSIVDGGYTGKCLRITNNLYNDARVYQKISCSGSSYYKITYKVKTEDVSETVIDNNDATQDKVSAGANISTYQGTDVAAKKYGTTDWEIITVYAKTAQGQKSFQLSLGLGGYSAEAKGVAYFDDLSIEKVTIIPEGAISFSVQQTIGISNGTAGIPTPWYFSLLFWALVIGLCVYSVILVLKTDRENFNNRRALSTSGMKPVLKDFIIILIMTAICTVFSFINLGDKTAASDYWKAKTTGEYVVVEFPEETNVTRTLISNNINAEGSSYAVLYESPVDSGTYVSAFNIEGGSFFAWQTNTTTFKTKRVKIVSVVAGLPVNEVGFFSTDANGEFIQIPVTVKDSMAEQTKNSGVPANLFNEQDTVPVYPSYMNGTYFDEIYHPRTAYENIHGLSVYETTHPPLGKLIIALGIKIFGMNPFGWRFMGTLFGVLLLPLMYLFALKIFKKRFYAFLAAFLIMFDFMRLTQSRLATIDTTSAFFVLLMFYFMYDYFNQRSYEIGFKKSLIPLFACGLSFGIGASIKWTCLYAGAGLAFLFFVAKFMEADDYEYKRAKIEKGKLSWFYANLIPTFLWCVLFFIIIPGTIYVLSYIPYKPGNPDSSLWEIFIENQKSMFSYHSSLTATHSYSSAWYQWPLIGRPLWYYTGGNNVPVGMKATIAAMGNPAIWWPGAAAIIAAPFIAWKKRDRKMIPIFVAFGAQYFPWILIMRATFIYHYFSAMLFMILMLVYCIKYILEEKKTVPWRVLVGVYMAITVVLFILFYPALTGMTVKETYLESLKWFSSWTAICWW